MELGMFTSGYQRYPLERAFADARRFGYDYVELWGGRPHAFAPDLQRGGLAEVRSLAEKYQMPVIYSTHPRSRNVIEKRGFSFHPLVQSMKPFGFLDYNQLQKNAYCVLSDSGTLSEESAILHFPAVLIRTSTERPEVLDKGTIVIGGIQGEDVEQAMNLAVSMFENGEETVLAENYADLNVSVKVVKIIQSYAKIVNLTTWRKG